MNNIKPSGCYINFRNLFLTLPLILLGACQKGTPLQPMEPSNNGGEASPGSRAKLEGLSAEAMGMANPNQYQVQLKWLIPLDGAKTWMIRRQESTQKPEESRPVGTPMAGQVNMVDSDVTVGKKYRYQLGYMLADEFVQTAGTEVMVPEDYVISTASNETQFLKYNRIYLTKDAKLITNGAHFLMNAVELHSDGAAITNFPEGAQAAPGQDGVISEPIQIKVVRAFGVLKIISNGQAGGVGIKGAQGGKGSIGDAGKPGGIEYQPGEGTVRGFEANFIKLNIPMYAEEWKLIYRCTSPGEHDGKPGASGFPGNQGYRGGKGGSSSSVFVQVNDSSKFDLHFSQSPGKGGPGGPGGEGGPGGDGGAGSWDVHHICPKPNDGATGPQGSSGPQGPVGTDGELLPVCIKLGDKVEGNCAIFN